MLSFGIALGSADERDAAFAAEPTPEMTLVVKQAAATRQTILLSANRITVRTPQPRRELN